MRAARSARTTSKSLAGQVVQHVLGRVEHGRVRRPAGALGQVGRVVADHEEVPPGARAAKARRITVAALRRRGPAGRRSPRGRGRPAGAWSSASPTCQSIRPHSSGSCSASRRPFSIATGEKSIAVTCQPRSASQRALRPSPHARSRARPGGRSASSCSTNWLGPADHTSSVAAYLLVPGGGVHELSLLRLCGLLRSQLAAYVLHVEVAHGLDQLVERRRRQRAGLGEDQDALAEDHQRRDRGDLRSSGQGVLLLGVDRAEGQVGVGLRRGLVGRRELAARAAPARPEVDEERVVLLDALLEVLTRQLDRGHGSTVCDGQWLAPGLVPPAVTSPAGPA